MKPTAAPFRFPYRYHRNMAQVMATEARMAELRAMRYVDKPTKSWRVPALFDIEEGGSDVACNEHPSLTVNAYREREAMARFRSASDGAQPESNPPRRTEPKRASVRKAALNHICPTCGSMPGFLCHGARNNVRTALHADRYAVARGEIPA